MGQCYSWSSGCIVSQRLFKISADQCDSGWDVRSIWALAGGRFHERVTSLKCVLPQAWFFLPCHSHIGLFKEQKSPKQSFYGKTVWLTLTHHWTAVLTSLRNLKLFSKISVNGGRLSHLHHQAVSYFHSPWMNPIWACMIWGQIRMPSDPTWTRFGMWSLNSPITLLRCRRCKYIVLWMGDNILKTCCLKHNVIIRHGKTVPEKQN